MEEQLDPQTLIDELVRRIQTLTLENVVLSARLTAAIKSQNETTASGDDTGQ